MIDHCKKCKSPMVRVCPDCRKPVVAQDVDCKCYSGFISVCSKGCKPPPPPPRRKIKFYPFEVKYAVIKADHTWDEHVFRVEVMDANHEAAYAEASLDAFKAFHVDSKRRDFEGEIIPMLRPGILQAIPLGAKRIKGFVYR